jgi:hypothetical protein
MPFELHETNAYGVWQAQDHVGSPYRIVEDVAELRSGEAYAVLTPDQFVDELQAAPVPFAMFHPMCGGMPIELAWSSLRLFQHEVLPRFV